MIKIYTSKNNTFKIVKIDNNTKLKIDKKIISRLNESPNDSIRPLNLCITISKLIISCKSAKKHVNRYKNKNEEKHNQIRKDIVV